MRRWRGLAALAVAAAVLLAMLGAWQLERRAWKLRLIAATDARLARAPVALPSRAAWPRVGAYTRLSLSGRWVAVRPAWVQAVTNFGPGWWMLSPLATGRGVVLVNRGFVPYGGRGGIPAPSGAATLTGLSRDSEPGGGFLRRNDPGADRWYSRDVAAIAQARGLTGTAPFFVDADRSGTAWPRGGMTVVRFRNAHLVYALTWFMLAAFAAALAWRMARDDVVAAG